VQTTSDLKTLPKDQEGIPSSTEGLLKYLKQLFPQTNPSVFDTLSQVQRRAGHQDVIEFIEAKLKESINVFN